MKTLYTAAVTAVGGRQGHIKSDDGVLDLGLAMPKALGGPGGDATNPEQLFAAGYSACFESALRLVARLQKKQLPEGTAMTAKVTLNQTDDGKYQLGVGLVGRFPGMAKDDAETLMNTAHEVCPYSRATRGNIDVTLGVDV